MNFPFFQKQTKQQPLTKVSMRYASTKEEVHEELCKLAWQMTCRNASYADARDVLQEGKVFPIPKDEYAQLDVRDFRVYGEDHYFPDDEEGTPSIVLTKGKLLGCIYEGKKGVTDLADRDDAHEFIERLEQVYKMWSDVEAGKKLPEEEPKKEDKKKSDEKGTKKEATKESETKKDAGQEQEEAKKKLTEFPKCALRNLYAELTNKEVLEKFKDESRTERNEFFTDLKAEYDVTVEKLQNFLQGFMDDLHYYATLIDELNGGTPSDARRFLDEVKAQRKAEGEPKKEKDSKDAKKEQEKSEEEISTLKNYIRRRKKKVNAWIEQAEEEDNEELLKLLDKMKFRLEKEDVEGYEALEAVYKARTAAGQQPNPDEDSAKGGSGKGKKGSDKKSDDSSKKSGKPNNNESGEGDDSGKENPDDSEDEDQEESSETGSDSDRKYPIKDVIAWMKMVGVTDIPVMLTMSADQTKGISARWVNEHMVEIGIDAKLAE